MIQRAGPAAVLILLGAFGAAVEAQDAAGPPYRPLFTDEMIRSAAPEQRERMRAAEENNRAAYERRRREREQATAVPAAPPAPPVQPRRSRIYKWVDDKGRVHFGDAPSGKGAREITIRSTTAPPAASADDGLRPPSRADSD